MPRRTWLTTAATSIMVMINSSANTDRESVLQKSFLQGYDAGERQAGMQSWIHVIGWLAGQGRS